ncbi:MAG: Wzz/FepE/Etk N-terminal domain-containing protein [Ferruginibacter sp.]
MTEASASSATIGNPGTEHRAGAIQQSVTNFIFYLIKKWWLFLVVGIIFGLVGIFYASKQKITYQSRLTFALDDGGEGLSGALSLAAQFGLSVGSNSNIFAGDNIIEILKSRRIVEKVLLSVDTFNNKPYTLIEYFQETTRDIESKEKIVHFPAAQQKTSFTYLQDSILYNTYLTFVNSFIAAGKPDRKLSIYEVNVTLADEKLTKIFTERLVTETNNMYIDISSSKAKKTLDVLEERVASMKGNLGASISGRASSQDANINPAFATSQVPALRQQANIQAYGSAYGELFKNLEMARFQYLNKIPLMQIIDPAAYPMKKIRMGKLKTGLIFAICSGLLLVFIFWLIRLSKMSRTNPSPATV